MTERQIEVAAKHLCDIRGIKVGMMLYDWALDEAKKEIISFEQVKAAIAAGESA